MVATWTQGRRLLIIGILGLAAAPTVHAQRPPALPDTTQRSGLITRFSPVVGKLPYDRDRDEYFVTRWAEPNLEHPNWLGDSGLYGLKWNQACTSCRAPYFRGYPGPGCVDGNCKPAPKSHRIWDNFIHPWRPVGYYYAGGCSVPVYDLDPLVTGPGPFPWPVFFKRPTGG
jgi:hypothetical protein